MTLTAAKPVDASVDCGYVCAGQIGDFVWNDLNGNGCQDPNEPGLPGVRVNLLLGCGPTATLIASTNTDSAGRYVLATCAWGPIR